MLFNILIKDNKEYIAACIVCAQNKSSSSPPVRLLHPLPTPGSPWSHIEVCFLTGLPCSGNTVILTIVEHFSKAAHFVALPKLASAPGGPCVYGI